MRLLTFIFLFMLPLQCFSTGEEQTGCFRGLKKIFRCGKVTIAVPSEINLQELGLIEKVKWAQREIKSNFTKTGMSETDKINLQKRLMKSHLKEAAFNDDVMEQRYLRETTPEKTPSYSQSFLDLVRVPGRGVPGGNFTESGIEALRLTIVLFNGELDLLKFMAIEPPAEFIKKEDPINQSFFFKKHEIIRRKLQFPQK
jgi:hypothetical protein